ncbi:hypothetical protein C8Q76DRAFT_792787 [Earliella scabrosa]|nr:hypothetical protein C8Q76DRAFT_792787 [Earliella scabrosa]
MAEVIGELPVELERMLLEGYDMLSLLNWRAVRGRYLFQVDRQLRKEMEKIVNVYVPGQASLLLDALHRFRAIITGEAAIAFLLRDRDLLGMDLELCVGEPEAEALHAFLKNNFVLTKVCGQDEGTLGYHGPPDRITTYYCIIAPRRRRYICVVSSHTPSPLTPLTAVNNTAYMTFFSPTIVGCAYPSLTMRRCALIRSDNGFGQWWSRRCDRRRNLGLVVRGHFRLHDDPSTLLFPRLDPPPQRPGIPDQRWCLGHLYLCACRDRYFGDPGSFVVVLDLHSSGLEYLLLLPASAQQMDVQGYGEELYYTNGTVLVTWRFPGWPVRCIGAWQYSQDLDGFNTGNAIHLTNLRHVTLNLEPRFVGEYMLEGRRDMLVHDHWRRLDPLTCSLPMSSAGREFPHPCRSKSRMFDIAWPAESFVDAWPADVCILVVQHAEGDALAALAAASAQGAAFVAACLSKRTRNFLRDRISDIDKFAMEIYCTGSVLTDTTALGLLYPSACTPGKLHIASPHYSWFHLVAYLVHCEGFSASMRGGTAERPIGRWAAFANLTKNNVEVEIIQSATDCPLDVVPSLWCTSLMAYMTATTFCVPYAELISQRRAIVTPVTRRLGTRDALKVEEQMDDLTARGWTFGEEPATWGANWACGVTKSPYCAGAKRYYGDQHCAMGPLVPRTSWNAPVPLRVDLARDYTLMWWRGGQTCSTSCEGSEKKTLRDKMSVTPSTLVTPLTLILPTWVPEDAARRAKTWAEYVSVVDGRFALSQVKIEDCAWEWFTDALLINSSDATVLIVGNVISVGYHADCWDEPVFKLELEFVRSGDRGAFVNLLNAMHEHPPIPRWFTAVKELPSTHMPTAPPAFDGTAGCDTFEAATAMEFLGVAPWDLVVVETRVESTDLGTRFNIERIMLLARAPEKPYEEGFPERISAGIGQHLDLRDLMTFRTCCRTTLGLVEQELRRTLLKLLLDFVETPEVLVTEVTAWRAYFGGDLAQAFIRRTTTSSTQPLQIYAPRYHAFLVVEHLESHHHAVHRPPTPAERFEWATHRPRDTLSITRLQTPKGMVHVYTSTEVDATLPITRSWSSHLVNYVNGAHFGSAFPTLLVAGRALLGRQAWDERRRLREAAEQGIEVRLEVRQWPDVQVEGCGANKWMCAAHPRSLTDPGAMCARFQPLMERPLGPKASWRLAVRPCGEGCMQIRVHTWTAGRRGRAIRTPRLRSKE